MKNRKTLKKLILGGLLLLSVNSLLAQTQKVHTLQAKNSSTATTMNPDALIQMDSDNKGLLLPRIALTGANKVAPLTTHTEGMVVYNTATVATSGTGATAIEAVTPGYYYNNGTKWVKIANTDTVDITNDAWVNNTTTNVVELATKADGTTTRTAGTEMVVTDDGNVGIGVNAPTAKLDVRGRLNVEADGNRVNQYPVIIKNNQHLATDVLNMNMIGFTDRDDKVYGILGEVSPSGRNLAFIGRDNYRVGLVATSLPSIKEGQGVLYSDADVANKMLSSLNMFSVDDPSNSNLMFLFENYKFGATISTTPTYQAIMKGEHNGNVSIGLAKNVPADERLHVVGSGKFTNGQVIISDTQAQLKLEGVGGAGLMSSSIRTSASSSKKGWLLGQGGGSAGLHPDAFTIYSHGETGASSYAYANRLVIAHDTGNVGIGSVLNPSERLEVAGNGKFTGTVATTGVLTTSDKRFKQDIMPVTFATQTVSRLRPVSYTWSALGKKKGGDNKKHIGFIAQEIEKVLPNLVNTDAKGYKSVNYIEVVPVLTKALQEQQKAIAKQQKEIEELKIMVKKLLK